MDLDFDTWCFVVSSDVLAVIRWQAWMVMRPGGWGAALLQKKLGGLWSNIPVSTFFNHSRFESFHCEGTSVVPNMATVSETQVSRRGEAQRVQYELACERIWLAGLLPHSLSLPTTTFTFFVFYFTGIQLQRHAGVWVDWTLGKNVQHCGLWFILHCWETCLAAF